MKDTMHSRLLHRDKSGEPAMLSSGRSRKENKNQIKTVIKQTIRKSSK
jgi:hypothetical protein